MHRKRQNIQGFTLIEIMVVVVILGILASIVVPNFMDKPDQARQAKAKQDIASMENAINLYKLSRIKYPDGLQDLVSAGELSALPKDPWGNDYQYQKGGGRSGKVFDLYTYGADGIEGGSKYDSDIGNWDSNQ